MELETPPSLELCARAVDVDPLASYAKLGYYANMLIMGRYERMLERLKLRNPRA